MAVLTLDCSVMTSLRGEMPLFFTVYVAYIFYVSNICFQQQPKCVHSTIVSDTVWRDKHAKKPKTMSNVCGVLYTYIYIYTL